MKSRCARALLVAAAAAMMLGVLGTGPRAAAAPRAPQAPVAGSGDMPAWAGQCGSGALGLGQDTVQFAQVLPSDTLPGGGPIVQAPMSNGKWVPVIMVHGWTSQDTHNGTGAFDHYIDLSDDPTFTPDVTRSLIGQLQRIPGAAVFTFDYHPYSARWVDDPHLGPALGKVIDCLYQASGERVIIVAHSMGGLIARYAATQPGVTGSDRSGEISSVVTFGTPETGSVAALLAATGINGGAAGAAGPVLAKILAVINLILSACGQLATTDIKTGTLCDGLFPPVEAFASQAGIALRAGSAQLAALKPWPRGITVTALAGNATFYLPDPGWFSLPWASTSVDIGDMIVTQPSALAGATTTGNASCRYQLDALSGLADRVLLQIGLEAKSQVAQQPLGSFTGACFHTHLMRDIELANDAVGAVETDIQDRQRLPEATAAAELTRLTPGSRIDLVALPDGWEAAAWDNHGHVTFWKSITGSTPWQQVGASTYPVVPHQLISTTITGALLDNMSDATFIARGYFTGDGTGNAIAFTNGPRGWGTVAPSPASTTLFPTGNRSTDNRTPGISYTEFFGNGDLNWVDAGSLPFGPNGEEWEVDRTYAWRGSAFQQVASTQFTAAPATPLPGTAPPFPTANCQANPDGTFKDFAVTATTAFTVPIAPASLPTSVDLHVQGDGPYPGCHFIVPPDFPVVISARTASGPTWITAPAWALTQRSQYGNSDVGLLLSGLRLPGQYGLNSLYLQDPVYSPYYVPKSLGITQIGPLASPVVRIRGGKLVAMTVLPTT